MKICQVIASHGEGGLEKHARDLTREFLDMGHEVTVLGDQRFLDTVPETATRIPVAFDRSRHNPLLLVELLYKLRRCRCDVVHAQANKAANLVGRIRRWLTSPVVGTLHNMKRDLRPFAKLDRVITVSRQIAAPFPPDRVSVVYNGIEPTLPEHFDLSERYGLPEGQPVLVAVGRLVEAKGFDLLLDAVDGLPVSLLIAGEGPERANLEKRIARVQGATRARLLGHQSQIPSLMAGADAVIISSRREGFSYVFNEALFCGVNVLSTDVPVANEVLPPELIVPVDDVDALRQRLESLLADTGRWDRLMAAPRRFAAEHMTKRAMAERTLEVYERLLTRPNPGSTTS